jgi:6-pyruvoyl-tetrahydropterin synthase
MSGIVKAKYRTAVRVPFSAARMIGEVISGHNFHAVMVLEADALADGEVFSRVVLHDLVKRFHSANLNTIMAPIDPTTENLAKVIGQSVLDFMFRTGDDQNVKLILCRITESEGEYAEVTYVYGD